MHKLGKAYVVETGVVATRRSFARSVGLGNAKVNCLQIVDGTTHLFIPDVLGPTVTKHDGTPCRTEWAVGGAMLLVTALPAAVVERYRLADAAFVAVTVVPPGHFRAFPTDQW